MRTLTRLTFTKRDRAAPRPPALRYAYPPTGLSSRNWPGWSTPARSVAGKVVDMADGAKEGLPVKQGGVPGEIVLQRHAG